MKKSQYGCYALLIILKAYYQGESNETQWKSCSNHRGRIRHGRETAILFVREGARVIAGDWNENTLEETVSLIRTQGAGEVSNEMWERVIGINLNGPLYLSRSAIQNVTNHGGGSIINIASVAGVSGAAAGVAYTTSNHALIGMTKHTAWRYLKEGIRCNTIAAGAVKTNIISSVDTNLMDPKGSKRSNVYCGLILPTAAG